MTIKDRASTCRVCGQWTPVSDADVRKLESLEEEYGCEISFYCETCNLAFVEWYRQTYGKDPTPACILDGRILH